MKYSFWNLENFFFLLDQDNYSLEDLKSMKIEDFRKLTHGINPNKDIDKIEEIYNKINELDSDFIGCCEMGGRESMHNFKKYYLKNYRYYIDETNSDRGIYVGAWIKEGIFSKVEVTNHGKRLKSSRNIMEFKLYKNDEIHSIVFVVHLKSARGKDGGINKRVSEVEGLMEVYNEVKEKCPILIMGDFNGFATKDEPQFEFDLLLKSGLQDVAELIQIPSDEKFTHFSFHDNKPNFNQLDYIFSNLSQDQIDNKESGINHYRDWYGLVSAPTNYDHRRNLCSDHLPISLKIKG